jgi:predicted metal-dependent peptidase
MNLDEAIAIADRRIRRARSHMLTTHDANGKCTFAFWATAALHLQLKPMPHLSQMAAGNIGTDGTYIIYDPLVYCDKAQVSDSQLIATIAHETSHCTKGDGWRRGSRDPLGWNIAADMRIDPELIFHGFEPPDHGSPEANAIFHNPQNKGKAAEQLYEEHKTNPPKLPRCGLDGDIHDPTDPTSGAATAQEKRAILEDLERKWTIIARQAAEIAKSQGHLPGSYEHLVRPVKPRLNPWDLIRYYVSMCRKDDYSWSRPNRRAIHSNLILPSLHSQGIGEIVIGIDTSGSCRTLVPRFLGFLSLILSEVKPERTIFIQCDTRVHNVTEYTPDDELPQEVPVKGYGGTSMRPIWQAVHDGNYQPRCAIVLSDMEMTKADFGDPQPYPVLWISGERGSEAPWGENVQLGD